VRRRGRNQARADRAGRARYIPGMDAAPIGRWLSVDHARLEALLRQSTAPAEMIDPAPYDGFRRGLVRHIGIEVKVLLPALRRALDRAGYRLDGDD
jgi:hypothetical protein